jgi:ATP-dependent Clp protease ATP-binding subunit ClpA
MVSARHEAQRLNHDYLASEHMLLGLIRDDKNSASQILLEMGCDHSRLRAATEGAVVRGKTAATIGQLPFTPDAKEALEAAMHEARLLGHTYIGTMHLLLGILSDGANIGAQALTSSGVTLEQLRAQAKARVDPEADMTPLKRVAANAHEARAEVRRLLQCAEELLRALEQSYLADEVASIKSRIDTPPRGDVPELLALLTSARIALEKRGESAAARAIEAAIVQIAKQR